MRKCKNSDFFTYFSDENGMKMSTKAHLIQVSVDKNIEPKRYMFMFHALLMGHEDWVHSVQWQPATQSSGKYHQEMTLVSASADKSIIIWKPDETTEAWISHERFGEVGGTTLGFYGAMFSPKGDCIAAHGYNGSIEFWRYTEQNDWVPAYGISGHQASVKDLAWDPSGQFFITTSLDQTTRLYGEFSQTDEKSWHELGRPQIHGYDLNAIAFTQKYEFVSGADEKVARVFEATRNFLQSMENITGEKEISQIISSRPVGASLPALGLSNKALFKNDANSDTVHSKGLLFDPPLEAQLLQDTLWPEKEKL